MYKLIFQNGEEVGSMFISARNNLHEIEKIEIYPQFRNKGYARKALEELVQEADENKLTLAITPSSDFGASKSKLTSFYKSLGFIPNKGKHKNFETRQILIRYPEKSLFKEFIDGLLENILK